MKDSKKNPWTKISECEVYDNPWINVNEHTVLNPSGNEGIYGKVHFKNQAVGVIPVDRNGYTWLVGQYRYTLDEYSWEIPEGGCPENESPLETAKRELREETGITAKTWTPILTMHLSNSVSDEIGYIFLAEDLEFGDAEFEDCEDIELMKVPFSTAFDMVMDCEITDSLSVAGILKLDRMGLIEIKVEILYEDEYCAAVNKPPDLLVHRTSMSKDKEFLLQIVRDQLGVKVHPIHRLDRPTSGIVLFALDKKYTSGFSEIFAEREIKKTYIAMVRGYTEDEGVIDYALKSSKNKSIQEARTEYKTLVKVELPIPIGRYETSRYSIVEINLKTGRMHQIRRHFKHIFHPLIGDTKYGDGKHNKMLNEQFNLQRLMLMAVKLEFTHPFSGEIVDINAPIDDDMQDLFSKMGFDWPAN
jgi:RluA family pseudouridine synthase